ncbi:HD-GYP domain-containing protein [Halobacillus litoralis]|uniref:HD-GYP domain-containing protein n=1 Tax=Halobacillus litoralis TaxID=45668 RepID=UPI002493B04D|nr:HD-GYP domain-containing protein [Halobacillus litoralis]
MRVIATKSLEPGTILGKTIFNENGQVLLSRGVAFTSRVIERLDKYDITYVYIEDGHTEDIETQYPISEKVRMKAIKSIKDSFSSVNEQSNHFVFEKSGREMRGIVRSLMNELRDHNEVISLLSDVFTYDDYIFTHSLNVTMYALALGKELQLPAQKMEELGLGAILHDIGKITVPKEVLLKPEKLNEEEFEIIKNHSEAGFEILRNAPNIPLVAAHCAYQHHERLNGSGYPRGIEENEIHLFGKILAVADVFDAVTSNRVYRDAMLPHEGLEVLYSGVGTLFDRKMVEAFRRCIAVYPSGLTVGLDDGRKGVVVRQHPHLCDRPIIRVWENAEPAYDMDLSKELNIVITNCDTTSLS